MAITCDIPGCRQPASRHLASLGPVGTKAQKDMHTLIVMELCPACTDRVGLGLGEYLGSLKDGSLPLPTLPEPEAAESPQEAPEAARESLPLDASARDVADEIDAPSGGEKLPPDERRGKRHRA